MSHSKEYTGRYVAEVVGLDDPQKKCRIKVNVYDIFDGVPVNDLPWATFSMPLGTRTGEGIICPVKTGDKLWVEFINGDTRRPVVVGGALASPGGVPNLPPEAYQGAGQYVHKRTPDEPPVTAPPYYQDVVFSQNNALIQICRAGNIRITQMTSGSAIEILPDGKIVIHAENNEIRTVATDTLLTVGGNSTVRISGNADVTIGGTASVNSSGAMTLQSASEINLTAPSINLNGVISCNSTGTMTMHAEGDINMTATGTVNIQ